MKSIKLKLVVGILLILSIFIGGIFVYGFTFKEYFQVQKLNELENLIKETQSILDVYDSTEMADNVNELSERYSVQIDIVDKISGHIIHATHNLGKNNKGQGGRNKYQIEEVLYEDHSIGKYIMVDVVSKAKYLTLIELTESLPYGITVKSSISSIDDAVKKSVTLLLIIMMPVTIIVLLLTTILSRKFTKPIIAITKKTSKIENLQFDEELIVNSKDEIGRLANSVNNLSSSIESTLNELKDKNNHLEIMIENERQNEIVRREFVSSVSHELKSPIAVISGYAQVLEEGIINSKEDVNYYLSVINEESGRMQVIVNDLLDLYKLESNTFTLEIHEVNLKDLVKRIIKKNELKFKEEDFNVIQKLEEVIVMADEIRLEQAIQNYINNAISHMDKDKILKITVTTLGIVTVFNSGKQIDEEKFEKIWQGFVRLDKVRNYKEKRVGLGLAIVKQIVKLHKGSCGVKNRDDGVEFWIKLPKRI
ncbi:HAMP domain-containing histidine kinase [Clostridium botulinum]|nr:HAMP domain-containing histidine kinase [Clostridium botulinum]NFR13642.1 HAMP domain-containing histidine kinase [Clostridium botulinum]NFR44431.1 HAMP domain-containing histidine kinase [Clostridium botulinum]NFS50863.1 HAMP domain-containing histidine kinase [Clostridium botulinum]